MRDDRRVRRVWQLLCGNSCGSYKADLTKNAPEVCQTSGFFFALADPDPWPSQQKGPCDADEVIASCHRGRLPVCTEREARYKFPNDE